MTRRILFGVAILLLFASMAAPAMAQTSGSPIITVSHTFTINEFGFGVVNDTITFKDNGTATEQVPTLEVGVPDTVMAHSAGFVVEPSSGYTMTSSDVSGVTEFTITPTSPTLAAGATTSFSLESYLTGILNFTDAKTTGITALILLSPQLNTKVSSIERSVVLPDSGTISPVPSGFNASTTSLVPTYTNSSTNITPAYSTETVVFNATDEASFQPVQVFSVVRTIAASDNGVPQVEDTVTLRNLADYSISSLQVGLLANVTGVTVLPSSSTPLINPTPVTLTDGSISLTSAPFVAPVQAGDNFTFSYTYPISKSFVSTSGTDVTVNVPYTLPLSGAVAQTYSVSLSITTGVTKIGQSSYQVTNANPFSQQKIDLTYSLAPGSGADQVVPIAAAVFAVTFTLLVMKRPETATKAKTEEEEEVASTALTDLTKSFEDKIALIETFEDETDGKEQGAVSRTEIMKTRTELDSLRSRAMHRLSEAKQNSTSARFTDLLNSVQEAAREEDRATKDLLNLYDQYHTKKMRSETFERLLPTYKRRLGAATNALSDLLHMVQKEATEE